MYTLKRVKPDQRRAFLSGESCPSYTTRSDNAHYTVQLIKQWLKCDRTWSVHVGGVKKCVWVGGMYSGCNSRWRGVYKPNPHHQPCRIRHFTVTCAPGLEQLTYWNYLGTMDRSSSKWLPLSPDNRVIEEWKLMQAKRFTRSTTLPCIYRSYHVVAWRPLALSSISRT